MKELLEQTIPWLEHSFLPVHDGPCTPETPCDMACVENAALSMLLHQIRNAIKKAEA